MNRYPYFLSIISAGFLLIIPQLFRMEGLYPVSLLGAVIYGWVRKKPGVALLVMSFSFCFPYSGDFDVHGAALLARLMWMPYIVMRAAILFLFVGDCLMRRCENVSREMLKFGLIFLFYIAFSGLLRMDDSDVAYSVNVLMYTVVYFSVVYASKTDCGMFFQVSNVVFAATATYAVLEAVFSVSPYDFFYSEYRDYGDVFRAKGILGHPLVLSAFVCMYQVVLYSKIMIKGKIDYLGFLLVIIVGALTVSRTTALLVVLCFLLYVCFSKIFLKPIRLAVIIMTVAACTSLLLVGFGNMVDDYYTRFTEGSIDQRSGAYGVILDVFCDYPAGAGMSSLKAVVQSGGYHSVGYDKDFFVIDNAYLSVVGAFGVFAVLFFVMYFYPLFIAIRERRRNGKNAYLTSIFLMYCIWGMMNFSFDTVQYPCVNMFFFTFMAVMLKEGVNAELGSATVTVQRQ